MNLRVFYLTRRGLSDGYDMYDNGGFRFMILPSASLRLSR